MAPFFFRQQNKSPPGRKDRSGRNSPGAKWAADRAGGQYEN
jgi:hypothetical protein